MTARTLDEHYGPDRAPCAGHDDWIEECSLCRRGRPHRRYARPTRSPSGPPLPAWIATVDEPT